MNFSAVSLQFGVSIEDFSYLDNFKTLLNETYQVIENSGYNIDELIRYYEGTLPDKILLKERIILGCPIRRLKIPPGTYLWIIKHFLSLLPQPLMNNFHGKKDNWVKLSNMCKFWFESRSASHFTSKELIRQISRIVMTMKEYNQLSFYYFFDFLRQLSVLPEAFSSVSRFNKNSAILISKYYSTPLFLKPFRMDTRTKNEKQYFALVLFAITKWPEISTEFVNNNQICYKFLQDPKPLNTKVTTTILYKKRPPINLENSLRKFTNSTESQTILTCFDFDFDYDKFSSECLNNDYLKDFGCQTETTTRARKEMVNVRSCCWCCENGRKFQEKSKFNDEYSQTETDHFVNEGHESKLICNETSFLTANSTIDINVSNPEIGWNIKNNCDNYSDCNLPDTEPASMPLETIQHTQSLASLSTYNIIDHDQDEDDTMLSSLFNESNWDNYSSFRGDIEAQSSPNTEKNYVFEDKTSKNELLKKISSIGWSYSPQIELEAKSDHIQEKSDNNFLRYRLNFERFAKEEPIEEIIEEEDVVLPQRTHSDDIITTKSKKKYMRFGKFKLVLNLFGNNSNKVGRSLSCQHVKSNVKYKKI